MQRFRGGLVFKAHRLLYHSTVGVRVIQKKKAGFKKVSNTTTASHRCESRRRRVLLPPENSTPCLPRSTHPGVMGSTAVSERTWREDHALGRRPSRLGAVEDKLGRRWVDGRVPRGGQSAKHQGGPHRQVFFSSSSLLSSLELRDSKVSEPSIRALFGTASHSGQRSPTMLAASARPCKVNAGEGRG